MKYRHQFFKVCAIVITTAALFGGCTPPLMAKVPKLTERDMDHAVVTFVRSSIMSPTYKAMLWDGETPIGELKTRSYIQYKASPGKHLFMVKSDDLANWVYLEANLITGEHYVVKVDVVPGFAARFVFDPLSPRKKNATREDIDGWLNDLKGQTLIKEREKSYKEEYGEAAKEAISDYESGKKISEILYPEDFWPHSP